MKRLFMWGLVALLVPMSGASAAVNGLKQMPRVFNDYPNSTLVMFDNDNTNGGIASILENNFGAGTGTNRHDFLLSSDGGSTAKIFPIDASFTFSSVITLGAGSNAPAKEAGLRVNSPITGDALFLVKTNGEIAAFGGGAPFFGTGDIYVPGTPIELTIKMTSGGDGNGGNPNFVEFIYDIGAGPQSSGVQVWANNEFGPVTYNLGLYGQGPPDDDDSTPNPDDFLSVNFADITFTAIPEPSSIMLIGLSLLGTLGMRRRS